MSRGASEDLVAKLARYEESDLPDRTKAALRLAEHLARGPEPIAPAFYDELRRHFTDDQILDLGMCIVFFSGWQTFIEAFGIVPDRWREGSPLPWEAILGPDA